MTPLAQRLQDYLRVSARRSYDALPAPPFTVFIHPTNDFVGFNYAIPDAPCGGDLHQALADLRRVFAARQRTPRFELIAEYAPELPAALRDAGFAQTGRYELMICPADSFAPPAAMPELTIEAIGPATPIETVQIFLRTNNLGFDPFGGGRAILEAEAERMRSGGSCGFLAWMDGAPVAAGSYTAPRDGLTELVGIATLEGYRRRGIGAALTGAICAHAFANGVDLAFLSAEDARAAALYRRIGFAPALTILAFEAGV